MDWVNRRRISGWTAVVLHSVRNGRHRYECQNCGHVPPIYVEYDMNYCPHCGMNAIRMEEKE